LVHDHNGVLPEDVQAVLPAVVGHRLKPRGDSQARTATEVGLEVLNAVPVP
jgi:MoxR-like ATPase